MIFRLLIFIVFVVGMSSAKSMETAEPTSETVTQANDGQYQWLYEKLFPESIRQSHADRTFKSFRVHLRDSDQRFPNPEDIHASNLKLKESYKGSLVYVGFVRKPYLYDVIPQADGSLTFQVRLHFMNASLGDTEALIAKLKNAQKIWNESQVPMDFRYQFEFLISPVKEKAHFSIWLLDSTRGPYDQFWGRNWSATTIAHEAGHMMGLGDEYQTITSESDCYEPSLMCESSKGSPMSHHYYFILRRLVAQQPGSLF